MVRKHMTVGVLTAAVILALTAAAAAGADLMVGPGYINAGSPLVPGRSYTLPVHEITNNSYRAVKAAVSVSEKQDEERGRPPAEWFAINREELTVQARSSEVVQVEVELPGDAPPGQYKVWFLFDSTPLGGEGVVTAASVEVSFTFDIIDAGQGGITVGNNSGNGSGGRVSPYLWAGAWIFLLSAMGFSGWLIYSRRRDSSSFY